MADVARSAMAVSPRLMLQPSLSGIDGGRGEIRYGRVAEADAPAFVEQVAVGKIGYVHLPTLSKARSS